MEAQWRKVFASERELNMSIEEIREAMSLETLTPQEASQRILAFLKDGRLVQGTWHKQNGGRELACMLGSLHPSISSPESCPSSVMPQWLAHVTVTLFDGQAEDAALAWAERYADLMSRWHALTDDAWKRCEIAFKIACVRSAIAAAEPVAKNKDYWPQVTAAAQQVCDALEGRGDLSEAKKAAYAAYAAAYAAYAAYAANAAYAAYATNAANAAANAAYAAANAAYATNAANAAANAAYAAANAAYATVYAANAAKLLDVIELEVLSAESLSGAAQ